MKLIWIGHACFRVESDGFQAAELVKGLNPRIAIPMHYRDKDFGFDTINIFSEFLEAMDGGRTLHTSEVDLGEYFENQVLVLIPSNAS